MFWELVHPKAAPLHIESRLLRLETATGLNTRLYLVGPTNVKACKSFTYIVTAERTSNLILQRKNHQELIFFQKNVTTFYCMKTG